MLAGHQLDRSTISYEAPGSETTRIMGVFLALGSIAFAFGDTILPEIQVHLQANEDADVSACMQMHHAHSLSHACSKLNVSSLLPYMHLCPCTQVECVFELRLALPDEQSCVNVL